MTRGTCTRDARAARASRTVSGGSRPRRLEAGARPRSAPPAVSSSTGTKSRSASARIAASSVPVHHGQCRRRFLTTRSGTSRFISSSAARPSPASCTRYSRDRCRTSMRAPARGPRRPSRAALRGSVTVARRRGGGRLVRARCRRSARAVPRGPSVAAGAAGASPAAEAARQRQPHDERAAFAFARFHRRSCRRAARSVAREQARPSPVPGCMRVTERSAR